MRRRIRPAYSLRKVVQELNISIREAERIEQRALEKLRKRLADNSLGYLDMAPAERDGVADWEPN